MYYDLNILEFSLADENKSLEKASLYKLFLSLKEVFPQVFLNSIEAVNKHNKSVFVSEPSNYLFNSYKSNIKELSLTIYMLDSQKISIKLDQKMNLWCDLNWGNGQCANKVIESCKEIVNGW